MQPSLGSLLGPRFFAGAVLLTGALLATYVLPRGTRDRIAAGLVMAGVALAIRLRGARRACAIPPQAQGQPLGA